MVSPRTRFEDKIESLKRSGASFDVIEGEIQQRGRDLRPMRITAGAIHLMMAAEKCELVTYDKFAAALFLRSHWERRVILMRIADLCKASGWPHYTSIVVRSKELVPGGGFFEWYDANSASPAPATDQERAQFVARLQGECFQAGLPDQNEILLKVALYLSRK